MNVKQIIQNYENEENYNEMIGWIDGLNNVNQLKHYVSNNAIYYEKYAKQNITKHGHMKASLILYYVSQEDDFHNWWYGHDTTNVHIGY